MASIKRNFVLNAINSVIGLLFPLISYPYASRILLADGIGRFQFFDSIISYIILLTSLGIPLYAIREVARCRDNRTEMSKISLEILLLHIFFSFFAYVAVFVFVSFVSKVRVDIPLFLLMSLSIFFNVIGVNWFYQGVEDFKYITIRSVVIKSLSLVALFLFVHEKEDLFYYVTINIVSTVGSNIFNAIRLRKYVDFNVCNFKDLHPFRHLRPVLKIFVLNLIISLYVNLDSVMLGFLKGETAVGYYSTSTKISKILIAVISSLGPALLPRMSNMIDNNMFAEFKSLAYKSISLLIALSLPLSIGLMFMASPMIHLFNGDEYEPSILTLKIMSPILIFIPISGIYNMQILYSLGKEKLSILSTSFGAIANFVLNLCLIPFYSHNGAGIATVIAEFFVMFISIVLGRKYVSFSLFSKRNVQYITASVLMTLFLILLKQFPMNEIVYFVVGTFFSVVIYYVYLMKVKNDILVEVSSLFINKLKKAFR